jgi:hypothetical protein
MAPIKFFENLKAKRAAKRAQELHAKELNEWQQEVDLLNLALETFTNASEGEEPHDQALVQKDGELVLWTGTGTFHEAGRTPSRYVGGSSGFSIPIVAGIRYRVGSQRGTLIPGEEMQMDKDQGFVKLTTHRLIFAGSTNATEWSFAKMLSVVSNPERNDYLIAVSNRKKTSGLKFSTADGLVFSRLLAMALHSFEEGIPATLKSIQKEIKELDAKKPMLVLELTTKAISN